MSLGSGVGMSTPHRMQSGNQVTGPALIEQQTTAIFVSGGFDCLVDALGSFVLHAKGREDLVRARAPQQQHEEVVA